MTPSPPDFIALACVSLTAARSADDTEVQTFYAATARNAIDQLEEQLKRLRLNLTALERELVAKAPQPKRMVGPERPG